MAALPSQQGPVLGGPRTAPAPTPGARPDAYNPYQQNPGGANGLGQAPPEFYTGGPDVGFTNAAGVQQNPGGPWANDPAAQAWLQTPEGQAWRGTRGADGGFQGARTSDFRDANNNRVDDRDEPWLHQPGGAGAGAGAGAATGWNPATGDMTLPPGAPPTGLIGAEDAYNRGLYSGIGALGGGMDRASSDVRGMIGSGVAGFRPYMAEGQRANDLMGAYSGAQGAGAQQQAYDNFISSPGQDWLRERGDRAVTRNASALGGLGGGRVMQELQRQGIGLAAQDFDNSFNRLSGLADRGMQGAAGAGNLYSQGASQLGNIGLQGGIQASNMYQNTGNNIAGARTQAGRDIAGGVADTTSNLADLINQGGTGFAEMYSQSGGNLASILSQMGDSGAINQEQLAQLLAQLGQGAGGNVSGLPGLAGGSSPGTTDAWGNIISAGAGAWDAYQGWGGGGET